MAKAAVIVPVYRVEKYLSRCVQSVLNQSFRDFCLILVDDGSPDNCPAYCDAFAAQDSRVHVIHQPNSGPSAARNRGLEWALKNSGCSYLTFLDGDDCLHPCCLERLCAAAETAEVSLVMCRHQYFREEQELLPLPRFDTPPAPDLLSPEDLVVRESIGFNYCWGKLYSASLFERLRFPENVSFGEDNLTTYKAVFAAEHIAFLPEALYFYFYSPTGITKMSWSPRSLECFLGIREQAAFYQANHYPRAYRAEIYALIQQYAYQIHRIRGDRENRSRNQPYLKKMLAEMRTVMAANRDLGLHSDYWFEALHPRLSVLRRFRRRAENRLHRLRRHK